MGQTKQMNEYRKLLESIDAIEIIKEDENSPLGDAIATAVNNAYTAYRRAGNSDKRAMQEVNNYVQKALMVIPRTNDGD